MLSTGYFLGSTGKYVRSPAKHFMTESTNGSAMRSLMPMSARMAAKIRSLSSSADSVRFAITGPIRREPVLCYAS